MLDLICEPYKAKYLTRNSKKSVILLQDSQTNVFMWKKWSNIDSYEETI